MKLLEVSSAALLVGIGTAAFAADLPYRARPPVFTAPAAVWTGFYVGAEVGGGDGISSVADPYGPSIYGDNVRTPKALGGGVVGYNYQFAGSPFVVGVEGGIDALASDGTKTCLAFSGFFGSANCRVRQHFLAEATGRLGYALGPNGSTLLYVKGGAAFMDSNLSITTNFLDLFVPANTASGGTRAGYTVGAGIEQMISPAWSVKVEYDYADFGSRGVAVPPGLVAIGNNLFITPGTTTRFREDIHTFKLGLNYRLGADASAGLISPLPLLAAGGGNYVGGYESEFGARYWYSFGHYQKDLAADTTGQQNDLNSRLTYANNAHSGELYGRVDTPMNVFLKGFIGGGAIANGKLNDEDWVGLPYSNTLSPVDKGNLFYATIDLGYDILRTSSSKVGIFAGYNYYQEKQTAFGCTQIANQTLGICTPAIPTSVAGIAQNDRWNSIRVGANGQVYVTPNVKLEADVAYLPYVTTSGTDNHLLRTDVPNTLSPQVGKGAGVQMELIASYYFTPNFSVGVGGRYWAFWATRDAYTNIFSTPCPCQALPQRADRYGTFVQASYKFGPEPAAVVAKY